MVRPTGFIDERDLIHALGLLLYVRRCSFLFHEY
jgi:hypothetical protein